MARSTLWQETAETIRAYLDGRLARTEAEAWAVNIIAEETFLSDELVLEQAVLTLRGPHHPQVPPKANTANSPPRPTRSVSVSQ